MSDPIIKKVPGLPFYASSDGKIYNERMKEYKTFPTKCGYLRFCTHIFGKRKAFCPHRLVAMAFLPNPNNLPDVNHKDEDKLNNHVSNLEWCSHKYNQNYGTRIQRQIKNQLNREDVSKAVIAFNGDVEFRFPSMKQAWREWGARTSLVCACCKGKRKRTKGFSWRYAE